MKSWKARLLVVLTMLAMLLAVSLPTMADPLGPRSDPRSPGFDPRFTGFDPSFADDGNGDPVVDEFSLGDLDCVVLGKERVDDFGRPFVKAKRLICVDPNGALAVDKPV